MGSTLPQELPHLKLRKFLPIHSFYLIAPRDRGMVNERQAFAYNTLLWTLKVNGFSAVAVYQGER